MSLLAILFSQLFSDLDLGGAYVKTLITYMKTQEVLSCWMYRLNVPMYRLQESLLAKLNFPALPALFYSSELNYLKKVHEIMCSTYFPEQESNKDKKVFAY